MFSAQCNITDRLTRCLCAVPGVRGHVFWVGTSSPRDNRLVGVEYDYDEGQIHQRHVVELDGGSEVWAMAARAGGRELMVAGSDPADRTQHRCQLWQPSKGRGEAVASLETPLRKVHTLEFEPNGTRASCVDADAFRVVDWEAGGTVVATWSWPEGGERDRIRKGRFSPHGSSCLCALGSALCVFDLRAPPSSKAEPEDRLHEGNIHDVNFAPNSPHAVATCGEDAKVRVWDQRSWKEPVLVLAAHTHWAVTCSFGPDDAFLLSSGTDSLVCLWNVGAQAGLRGTTKDAFVRAVDEHEDAVYACCWSAYSADVFASVSYDGHLLVHRLEQA